MIKTKKLLAMTLSLAMVFALTACGGDKGNQEPVDIQPPQEVVTPPIEDTTPEFPEESTTDAEITPVEPETETPEEPEIIIADMGNIVRLKNDDVALLIIGKDFTDKTSGKEFEYISVMYPQGLQNTNTYLGFNFEDIAEVLDVNNIILRTDLNFETGESYTAVKVSTDLNSQAIEALTKEASKYTVYQKTTTENGITIGVTGLEYIPEADKDVLIFDLIFENGSQEEIITNGRLDIILSDPTGQPFDCNDALIDATDIINFKIPAGQTKEGRIAFEIPKGEAEGMMLTYASQYIPAVSWFVSEVNIIK